MATRSARSVDRTVDKMLRQMAQSPKASAGASGSSSTAAQALAQMAEIQKRLARGDTDAAQFLIEKATASKAAEAEATVEEMRKSLRAARDSKAATPPVRLSRNHLLMGAGGVLACATAVLLGLGLFGNTGHSVAGTIFVDEQSAADLELIFHSVSRSDIRVKIKTAADGSFAVESLPAGDYRIILLPRNAAPNIPKHYSSPISTPLRLKLHEDTSDLTMNVASEKKSRQG